MEKSPYLLNNLRNSNEIVSDNFKSHKNPGSTPLSRCIFGKTVGGVLLNPPSPSLFRFKETKKHSTRKVTQIIDFPVMTPKQNADILLAMFVTFLLFEQISSNKLL